MTSARATLASAAGGAAMNLVVEPLDEGERHRVLLAATGGTALLVPFGHCGELLVGLEARLPQRRSAAAEKAARPAFAAVVPRLPKGVLENAGRVQLFVGGQPLLGRPAPIERQLLRCEGRVCFWPSMYCRSLRCNRWYPLLPTLSSASPKGRIT